MKTTSRRICLARRQKTNALGTDQDRISWIVYRKTWMKDKMEPRRRALQLARNNRPNQEGIRRGLLKEIHLFLKCEDGGDDRSAF